jgi:hypothetical protein
MFNPRIGRTTSTPDIQTQVVTALVEGQTVRLGRWTASPLGGGRVEITRHSENSRNGPLVSPESQGAACPESQAGHSLVQHWLGDW